MSLLTNSRTGVQPSFAEVGSSGGNRELDAVP